MRVYLGSDHAGFELKQHLVDYLTKQGYECVDVGPHVYDPEDDLPVLLPAHRRPGGGRPGQPGHRHRRFRQR